MDEDDMKEMLIEEVSKSKLGFVPQKENVYNKLLPYGSTLDEEADRLYVSIKTNLVKAFLAREMRPGIAIWTSRLLKYIKIYGLRFSKEDHIYLIKIYYNLVTIPKLEPTRVNKFAITLTFLLKKKDLLSRKDLVLEWKPLYDLCKLLLKKSTTGLSPYRYFNNLPIALEKLINAAKIYFPVEATQEILDEFRPRLCPFNPHGMMSGIDYMESFLPVMMQPEEASLGYKLWFEEFMTIWDTCHNVATFENSFMNLMSELALNNIGSIDWEPYVPFMFGRFKRALHLPVYYQKWVSKPYKIDVNAITVWIVSVMGHGSSVFDHLEKFMKTLESYFHSANSGRWSAKVKEFFKKISLNFVNRLHIERHKKKTWLMNIPESHKLKEEDIHRFIKMMVPCIELCIYSRTQDTALTFSYLAAIRPNVIIPILLDKLQWAMGSLTEPHKLTSAMLSVTAVSRYMVQGQKVKYPDGPKNVIPLLHSILPGIDPNDMRKCFMTFNFIVQFVNMVPLIDSSNAAQYHGDLTEEEKIVCEQTATFEDFVLQFFDKLCVWVESNAVETTRMEQNDNDRMKNRMETVAETALVSVISSVLYQCSPEIFNAALKKIYNFATSRIFEIKVSGKMIGIICQMFGHIDPHKTAKLFIPHLCDTIETFLSDNSDLLQEENINVEFLYNLMLLSEIVDLREEVVVYIDRIIRILDKTLFMTSLQGSQLSARMLNAIMTTLTITQPKEYRSSSTPYDSHVKDFLSTREWGKAGQLKELKIDWYTPGKKEIDCVETLLYAYLIPELEKLDKYCKDEVILNRENLRKSFRIILATLGCHVVLPLWEEPPLNLIDSVLEPWEFELKVSDNRTLRMPNGKNVRKVVADTLNCVQKKILATDEGDTKSIFCMIHIFDILLFNKYQGRDLDSHWKNFHLVKTMLEDKLLRNKKHLRHILIDRVMLHQEFRNESRTCTMTETHKQIILNLFNLSVSHYSEVRRFAQNKLFTVLSMFPYSYHVILPRVTEILQLDSTKQHETFKGCLYILVGSKSSPIIARHNWEFIKDIWPLLVKSQPSEKVSIVNLIDTIVDTVLKFFPTIAIDLEISDNVLNVGYSLASNIPIIDLAEFQGVISNGPSQLKTLSQQNLMNYNEAVDTLLDIAKSGILHWRYHNMAVTFMKVLIHPDVHFKPQIVEYFCKELINESISRRKMALKMLVLILIQTKRKFKKITIDPLGFNSVVEDRIGLREDNKWLCYNSLKHPSNSEEWDEAKFVHDEGVGFYSWPKSLEVYAPSVELAYEEFTGQQKEIYNFFNDERNISLLIKYFSMEEKKGHDKFNSSRFRLFKGIFKLFEDKLLIYFLPHLEQLTCDKQESNQRCAVEILMGVISGCKHWNYEKTSKLWSTIIPLLRTALNQLSVETLNDWAIGINHALCNRDPNRYYWFYEFLMDDPLNEQSSFISSNRLSLLQIAINNQLWRNGELFTRFVAYIEEYLSHPFQNVRDKISLSLVGAFALMLSCDVCPANNFPNSDDFFKKINPKLKDLHDSSLKNLETYTNHHKENNKVEDVTNHVQNISLNDVEKEDKIKLFKVVTNYLKNSLFFSVFSAVDQHFEILPLVCILQSNDVDDELKSTCTNYLSLLGNALILPKYLASAINSMELVVECPFWSARAVIATFIPVFVFHNMSTIIDNASYIQRIEIIALKLIEDVQPEVRLKASRIISGLIHCNVIKDPMDLLENFKVKAKTKLIFKYKGEQKRKQHDHVKLRQRHAGVLGLCSFIDSHPYDVPDYIPSIFGELGPHLSDPEPIPTAIRKTLGDFKRTHIAEWEVHKLKFTEDELLVLSDLTVPPSYYA